MKHYSFSTGTVPPAVGCVIQFRALKATTVKGIHFTTGGCFKGVLRVGDLALPLDIDSTVQLTLPFKVKNNQIIDIILTKYYHTATVQTES